eukprot:scaffold303722_cov28-Tisochrysis_lutea.AAC.2
MILWAKAARHSRRPHAGAAPLPRGEVPIVPLKLTPLTPLPPLALLLPWPEAPPTDVEAPPSGERAVPARDPARTAEL